MSIAYVSADEVNRHLAGRMAEACGAALHFLSRDRPQSDGLFDAILYDLDSMPPTRREEILACLLTTPSPSTVAVHSYALDLQADLLRDRGIVVTRRLESDVFLALRRKPLPDLEAQVAVEAGSQLVESAMVVEISISPLGIVWRD